jgi:hypothetical protein
MIATMFLGHSGKSNAENGKRLTQLLTATSGALGHRESASSKLGGKPSERGHALRGFRVIARKDFRRIKKNQAQHARLCPYGATKRKDELGSCLRTLTHILAHVHNTKMFSQSLLGA